MLAETKHHYLLLSLFIPTRALVYLTISIFIEICALSILGHEEFNGKSCFALNTLLATLQTTEKRAFLTGRPQFTLDIS